MKGTVIFADQDQREEKVPTITLTKDEYKEVIKEAYKEGVEEALETQPQKHKTTQPVKNEEKKIVNEGEKEAAKTQAKEVEQTKRKLDNLIERHEIELMRVKSIFPFQLFPDTLIIDTTKITIIQKTMFATETILSCALKDLSDVHAQTAFFMATLYIKYMPQSPSPGMNQPKEINITSLRREDAMKAKNILRGALVAAAEKIDISTLSHEEVATVLEKFGKSDGVI